MLKSYFYHKEEGTPGVRFKAALAVASKTSQHRVKPALAVVALETHARRRGPVDEAGGRRSLVLKQFNSSAMAIVKTEKVRSI